MKEEEEYDVTKEKEKKYKVMRNRSFQKSVQDKKIKERK